MHTGWVLGKGPRSTSSLSELEHESTQHARMSVPGDLVAVQDPDVAGCLLVKLTVACCYTCCSEPFPPYGKP